jgi:VWFA-related protein
MREIKVIWLLATLFIVTVASSTASGQDDDVITVDSSLVRLNIGVVDQRGRPVTSLSAGDFTVFEDGVRQKIVRFEPTVAPFSVVMLLDMSGSTLGFRETIRQSAYRFIDALDPNDRVAVIEFYERVNVLNDFTTKRESIANSIRAANGRGKTQFFKALELAVDKLSKERGRRKAVIVLTDGIDTPQRDADRTTLEKLAGKIEPSSIGAGESSVLTRILGKTDLHGITIYPLALPTGDPFKLADPTPTQVALYTAARNRLGLIADRTGGTVNTINRLEEMGRLYAEVAASVRTLYTVEYESTNEKRDGKWRAIGLETSDTTLVSRTRTGYFAR